MRQDESANVPARRQVTRLAGCEVTVLLSERGVVVAERALRHQQVDAVGKLLRPSAGCRVHDKSEALAGPRNTDVLQTHTGQLSFPLEPADVGSGNPCSGQPLRKEGAAVGFHQPVTVRLDPVVERPHLQARSHHSAAPVRVQPKIKAGGGEGYQRPDHVLAGSGEVQVDRVLDAVQDHPGKHSGQAVAVVAMDVGEADTGDLGGRNPGEHHLALCALAGVEEQALTVPQQQIAVVVTGPGGDLGGGAEDHEFTHGTECATARATSENGRVTDPGEFVDAALQREGSWYRAQDAQDRLGGDLRFYGASVGAVRGAIRDASRRYRDLTHDDITALSSELWEVPVFERRLAAIVLLQTHVRLLKNTDLTRLEGFVRDSRLPELVDPLAVDVIGPLVTGLDVLGRVRADSVLDRWARDPEEWLRRASILSQLRELRRSADSWTAFVRRASLALENAEAMSDGGLAVRAAISRVVGETAKNGQGLEFSFHDA